MFRSGFVLAAAVAVAAGCRSVRSDLSTPRLSRTLDSPPVAVATAEKILPIVALLSDQATAVALANAIADTCGRRPPVVVEFPNRPSRLTEGLFVGDVAANRGWTCALTNESAEAFRVVADGGCVRFLGRTDFAVSDWCERALGMRFYCPPGRCVERRTEIVVPAADYSDCPVFEHRVIGGNAEPWVKFCKAGSVHRGGVQAHAPSGWVKDVALKAARPEIFETGDSPMLCYGNPATLAYYRRRIDRHIAGLEDSGGIVNTNRKVVTVCQWDAPIKCDCPWCCPLYAARPGHRDSASAIIWGRFLRHLAVWLDEAHPDYEISFLPYLNTCALPPDWVQRKTVRGARGARLGRRRTVRQALPGNCEAEPCTMPGVALLKDAPCRRAEERLIRDWRQATGRKVMNWHYSCWPADFTSAPYVFGRTVRRHYADCRRDTCGSFVCGSATDPRLALSTYVWMRCLWNPDVDVEAIYDGFARRMFGPAERPMRELIALQEACWERPWADAVCSYRNVHGTSFPPEDVDRMMALLREAFARAAEAGDEAARRRIRWYASGFEPFLTEATALARRAKSGRTDFPPGATRELVVSRGRGAVAYPRPWARTTVKSAVEDGELRLDVRCEDPAAPRMDFTRLEDDFVRGNDCVMFIFGEGPTRRAATVYLTGEVTREGDWIRDGAFEAMVRHDEKGWSVTARIRPSAAERAAGRLLGNVCRWRVGERRLPKAERVPGSRYEQSRLDTRYTRPNDDPAAYVEFKLR